METVNLRMKPKVGDSNVAIPITLRTAKVLGEARYRNRIYLAMGMGGLVTLLTLLWLFFGGNHVLIRIILAPVILYATLWVIRYLVLEESLYRKNISRQIETDFRLTYPDLWDIFDVEDHSPHICHYSSGKKAIFIVLQKGVRIGKDTFQHRFEHYDRLADAFRVLPNYGVSFIHMDIMGSIGQDPRIARLYSELPTIQNDSAREVLGMMYSHLQAEIEFSSSSQDVICLYTTKGSEKDLISAFHLFSEKVLATNYSAIRTLDKEGIRSLIKELFNLVEFSANEASLSTLEDSSYVQLLPVRLIRPDGTVQKLTRK